ncbi:MAG: hypothetical protein Q8Q06_03805 [bacterium]|nr:hypothetical protein [bacterium]
MEEFRHIECGGCQTVLRFKITEKNYGRTGTVECKECGCKNRVTIPFPPSPSRVNPADELKEFIKSIFPGLKE